MGRAQASPDDETAQAARGAMRDAETSQGVPQEGEAVPRSEAARDATRDATAHDSSASEDSDEDTVAVSDQDEEPDVS